MFCTTYEGEKKRLGEKDRGGHVNKRWQLGETKCPRAKEGHQGEKEEKGILKGLLNI